MKLLTILFTGLALIAGACGGDDDSTSPESSSSAGTSDAGSESSGSSSGGSGGGGTLIVDGETIALDSARCFLEEQDAVAGGGKIVFVVQAYGSNAAGDPLVLDVSRYDEDSMFTGDEIIIDFGDPASDDAVSWTASTELGTIAVDGSSVSAEAVTLVDTDAMVNIELSSFEINC